MRWNACNSLMMTIPALIVYIGQITHAQTVTDFDGNIYPVFQAGKDLWMGENLRVSHDPKGNPIEFYAIQNPYMDSCRYGLLYDWSTATDSIEAPGTQGICPDGWHLPTDAEWDSLTEWAGGVDIAGIALKKSGQDKFEAIMAGNYNPIQKLHSYFGEHAYFWTSDSYSLQSAWMRHLGHVRKNIDRSTVKKHYGFSVRCVRD